MAKKIDVPEGLWQRCPACEQTVYQKDVEDQFHVCPQCGFHHRISARERVRQLSDPETFEEFAGDLVSTDPLKFEWDPGDGKVTYRDRLQQMTADTGEPEAMIVGKAFIRGRSVVLGAMDPFFIMGSMGAVTGEKVVLAVERATEEDLPLVLVTASGGARMHEGMVSLMQMARTSAALARFDESGGLYIVVMTDPTTAGVAASFAFLGDFILAEPGALIGFAGPRVIWNTIRAELPEGFQRSEFMLDHGFIDRVVARKNLRSEIARIIDYCGK
ncbi:MAG: acetyl-CoA carboxylase carboxyltransferase subunit beta [Phycisphaerae bacterium]|nr:acetyl-CoA carboxylase carboxyltransferase subunit beta [Phycisphaerae bacterium]